VKSLLPERGSLALAWHIMRSPLLAVFALTFVNEFTFAGSATWNSDPTNEAIKVEMLGGAAIFQDNSTAGSGTFINGNGGGEVIIGDNATASHASFTNEGGGPDGAFGGGVAVVGAATADEGVFINNGGVSDGTWGGTTQFYSSATAGNSILIANPGTSGGNGGTIYFLEDSTGDTSRIQVFGNGQLDISFHTSPEVTVGSIKGDGLIVLGSNTLTVGSNGLNTVFSGTIQDSDLSRRGSLVKIGTGELVLSHPNTYTGTTTISDGVLVVRSRRSSATGPGPVFVNGGTLGGIGLIAGSVSVGTGTGSGAALSPGQSDMITGALTIKGGVTLHSDGSYEFELDSDAVRADEVIANGVIIDTGVQFEASTIGSVILPEGTVFTAISNVNAEPISGTFSNLPDGGIITIGSNTFQANYEGGDGNDLTLTVIP